MNENTFKDLMTKFKNCPNRKVMFSGEQMMVLAVMEWLFRHQMREGLGLIEKKMFEKALESFTNVTDHLALNNRWFEDAMNIHISAGRIPFHAWDQIQDYIAAASSYMTPESAAKSLGVWKSEGTADTDESAGTDTILGQMDGHNA